MRVEAIAAEEESVVMMDLEMYAQSAQRTREETAYRRADRLAPLLRDLEREQQSGRIARRPAPARWAGHGLIGLGSRMVRLGRRLGVAAVGASAPQA